MTPKEKALELYYKYYQKCADSSCPKDMAKECVLIAVDEILESCYLENEWFFEEVKEEINKL